MNNLNHLGDFRIIGDDKKFKFHEEIKENKIYDCSNRS